MEPSIGRQVSSLYATAPAFSMGDRRKPLKDSDTPGPVYEPVSAVGKQPLSHSATAPRVAFGTGHQRPPIRSVAQPGPGEYGAPSAVGKQSVSLHMTAPAFSMKYRQREVQTSVDKLGPGSAPLLPSCGKQVRNDKATMPAFSFPSGRDDRPGGRASTPGPGAYRPSSGVGPQSSSLRSSAPSYSLSSRHTFKHKQADNVGPGRCRTDSAVGKQVESTKKSAPKVSFGTRSGLVSVSDTPAPGTYNAPDSVGKQVISRVASSPAYTLSGRHRPLAQDDVPAPSTYNAPEGVGKQPTSTKKTLPAFSFGTGKRPALSKTGVQSPSPDTYSPMKVYATSAGTSKGKGPTMSGRNKFGSIRLGNPGSPGPGQYETTKTAPSSKSAPAMSIGRSRRDHPSAASSAGSPGPGQYDMRIKKTGGPAYSLAFRTNSTAKQADVVGPGRCRTDEAVGKQVTSLRRTAPKFAMGIRFKDAKRDDVPGPGSYGAMRLDYVKTAGTAPRRTKRGKVVV